MGTLPDIGESLYNLLVADTGITDLVSTRIYQLKAPTTTTSPYVLFYKADGGIPNLVPRQQVDFMYRVEAVQVVQGDGAPTTAKAIQEALFTALHDVTLTVTDWTNYLCWVTGTYEIVETENKVDWWQMGVEINIRASKDDAVVVSNELDPSTLTSPVAAWSVHEDDIANVYQDSAKTTPAVSDGDVIGAVVQLTGFGAVDATQTTTAAKPLFQTDANGINNHNAALFDGSDDFWNITGVTAASGAKTVYIVAKPTIRAIITNFLVLTGATFIISNETSGTLQTGYYDGSWKPVGVPTGNNQILSYVLGSGSGEIFRDGASIGTATYTDKAISGNCYISFNAVGRFAGLIGAIYIYNAEHSTAEREAMEAHLASKWGITLA